MRILLVEDDDKTAAAVRTSLTAAGYVVDHESDGEQAWFRGDTEPYAAIVLDLGLPGMDGLSILRKWRQAGQTFPVLILTARGNWSERVEGIDAGADDYLPKPFQIQELLALERPPQIDLAAGFMPWFSRPLIIGSAGCAKEEQTGIPADAARASLPRRPSSLWDRSNSRRLG